MIKATDMNTGKSLILIDGRFSPKDAFELLMNLYSKKIQFHQMKNFSAEERFGKEDEGSLKRIAQLKESLEVIQSIIMEEAASDDMIEIKSTIDISVIK